MAGNRKPVKTAAVGKLALRTGARITGFPASAALTFLDESMDPRMEVFLTDDPPNLYYELMYGTPSPWGRSQSRGRRIGVQNERSTTPR